MFSCYGGSVHQWDKVNSYPISSNGMGLLGITAKQVTDKDKACPLNINQVGAPFYYGCIKEKCEWYLPESNQCSIPVIARKLQKL